MKLNRNGIPINRRESIGVSNDRNVVFEFSFPPATIKKFGLDKQINAFATVKTFKKDYLYVSCNPLCVHSKIQQICGKNFRYGCATIPEWKGA